MKNRQKRTYTYTAHGTSYWTLAGTMIFLFVVEGGLVALLIHVLIHNLWLSVSLNSVHILLCLFVIGSILTTRWSSHSLTAYSLTLHYGRSLHVSIPRANIKQAEPLLDRKAISSPLMATYDENQRRIVACYSEYGQVMLRLYEPLTVKMGKRMCMVSSLLFNVDRREMLLDEITGIL